MSVYNKHLSQCMFVSVFLWRPQPNRTTECSLELQQ